MMFTDDANRFPLKYAVNESLGLSISCPLYKTDGTDKVRQIPFDSSVMRCQISKLNKDLVFDDPLLPMIDPESLLCYSVESSLAFVHTLVRFEVLRRSDVVRPEKKLGHIISTSIRRECHVTFVPRLLSSLPGILTRLVP